MTTDFEDVATCEHTSVTEKTPTKTLQLGACQGVSWASKETIGDKRRLWRAHGATYTGLLDRAKRQLPLFPDLNESEVDCACTD